MSRNRKTLSKKEKLEIILNNPILYIENFMKIADKNGKIIDFKLNKQQLDLLSNLEKYNIVLKSRQLGISSLTTALSLYYACTRPNTTSLLLSYSIDSANGIFDKLKQLYYDMPTSIKPSLENNNKKELKFSNGSKIVVATNGNKDVARGLTLNGVVHISEMAFMKDTIKKNLLAIEQATSRDGVIIVESTANGLNFFNEFWNKSENGENMYKPFFFSWVDDKVMFADEYEHFYNVWKSRNNEKILSESDFDEEEVNLFEKGATIKQLIWRRLKISNSSKEQFRQEFPSTSYESFITSGEGVFDVEYISERERFLPKALGKKEVLISSTLSDILSNQINNGLNIYEKPISKKKYYIGVDASEGLGLDYSVVDIISEERIQVAQYRSNKVKPYMLSQIVHELAKYYNNAYIVVEKASSGHTVLDRLKNDYKYANLHKYKEYDSRGRRKKKIGFSMNEQSKIQAINDLVEFIETGQLLINSKYTLQEMKNFGIKDGKLKALSGNDDTIISLALCIVGIKAGIWYV